MLIGKALPRDSAVEYLFKKKNIQSFLKMGQSASCRIGVNQKEYPRIWGTVMWGFKFYDQFPSGN